MVLGAAQLLSSLEQTLVSGRQKQVRSHDHVFGSVFNTMNEVNLYCCVSQLRYMHTGLTRLANAYYILYYDIYCIIMYIVLYVSYVLHINQDALL